MRCLLVTIYLSTREFFLDLRAKSAVGCILGVFEWNFPVPIGPIPSTRPAPPKSRNFGTGCGPRVTFKLCKNSTGQKNPPGFTDSCGFLRAHIHAYMRTHAVSCEFMRPHAYLHVESCAFMHVHMRNHVDSCIVTWQIMRIRADSCIVTCPIMRIHAYSCI